MSHLRRVNTPIEKTGKLVQPRKLHPTQWGVICPSETPEGASVGLVKNMALLTGITISTLSDPVRRAIGELGVVEFQGDLTIFGPPSGSGTVRVFVNGDLMGSHAEPDALYNGIKALKRAGSINVFASIVWNVVGREICITTEGGRFIRPLIIRERFEDLKAFMKGPGGATACWSDLVLKGFVEYLDDEESNSAMIAMNFADLSNAEICYTHVELDPSAMLGVVAGSIPFSDHNQAPRNTYQVRFLTGGLVLVLSNTALHARSLPWASRPSASTPPTSGTASTPWRTSSTTRRSRWCPHTRRAS
jgi:DNA-directed RNA polymerase II subunit RPB2